MNGSAEDARTRKPITWVDAEVHLLPPEWCAPDYSPPTEEDVLRRVLYDHPERETALSRSNAPRLLEEMDRCGIAKAVIMGLPWKRADMCWENNRYIAEVVREWPERFIGMGVIPPPHVEPAAVAVTRVAEEFGLRGVKVIPSWQGYRLDDAAFEPALREMTDRGLVLVPHTDHAYVDPARSDPVHALYEVGHRFSDLRILAPHLGGLLCLYALHQPVRAVLDNMLFITTVPTTMQMVLFARDAVGAERLAFGTDYPFNPSHDQKTQLAELEQMPLAPAERAAIAGGNVLRFLGLA